MSLLFDLKFVYQHINKLFQVDKSGMGMADHGFIQEFQNRRFFGMASSDTEL